MKKLFILTFILLISMFSLFAQANKKWKVIDENSESIFYLDTKNVRELDNKISVWSLLVYKKSTKTDDLGHRIGKVKTQYLFNKTSKKYAVVGSLVYDEIGRMIKNESQTTLAVATDKFEFDISDDKNVELLFNKAVSFLENGDTEFIKKEKATTENIESENLSKEDNDYVFDATEETSDNKKNNSEQNDKTNISTATNKNVIVFKGTKKKIVEAAEPVKEIQVEKRVVHEYNVKHEKIIKGVIFSDGNLFVVQKASFKKELMARAFANRLKEKGEKAFVVKANIPGKGTWYRVRVGYFNSLQEAERYSRKH